MKLKIGDRVKIISVPNLGETSDVKITIGMTGTVKELSDGCVGVEFDDYMGGHDGCWEGKDGYCLYMLYERLEKIDETKEEVIEETKAETMEQKIIETLRKEIGVDIGEEFYVYENGEKQWTCRFDEIGFSREVDDEFKKSGVWKGIVCKFRKYTFKRRAFIPKLGERYFILAIRYDENKNISFTVLHRIWTAHILDHGMLSLGNVYRSEKEALKNKDELLEKLEKLRKGE